MRENAKAMQSIELSFDRRQAMAIIAGSLLILGACFVLGLKVGRQVTARAPAAVEQPKDPLAALDQPPKPAAEPPTKLKAHEALTDPRPLESALPPPAALLKPAPISLALPQTPPVAPAPGARPASAGQRSAPPAKASTSAAASPAAARPVAAKAAPAPAAARPAAPMEAPAAGAFTVQVGASASRADAERLAKKLAGRSPRIVEATLPGKGRVYRVRVGSFETRDAAERYQAALASEIGVKGFVTPR